MLLRWLFIPWVETIRFGYEKAGYVVYDEPIPWNAEAVLVEFLIQDPGSAIVHGNDYCLRGKDSGVSAPREVPVKTVSCHSQARKNSFCLHFRLGPLLSNMSLQLTWRGRFLGKITLPYLSPKAFFRELAIESPSTMAQIGEHEVICRTVVAGQCHHLTACCFLKSSTSLLPLIDWDLALELTCHDSGQTWRIPAHLTGSQVVHHQSLLNVTLFSWSCTEGQWSWRWVLAHSPLAQGDIRVISQEAFHQSLYLAGGLSRSERRTGAIRRVSPEPPTEDTQVLPPCLRIASHEPGVAALCDLKIRVQYQDRFLSAEYLKMEVLITDLPLFSTPLPIAFHDGKEIQTVEVFADEHFIGSASLHQIPVATFTTEGGFQAPEPFDWTPCAEEELQTQLGRLLEQP